MRELKADDWVAKEPAKTTQIQKLNTGSIVTHEERRRIQKRAYKQLMKRGQRDIAVYALKGTRYYNNEEIAKMMGMTEAGVIAAFKRVNEHFVDLGYRIAGKLKRGAYD